MVHFVPWPVQNSYKHGNVTPELLDLINKHKRFQYRADLNTESTQTTEMSCCAWKGTKKKHQKHCGERSYRIQRWMMVLTLNILRVKCNPAMHFWIKYTVNISSNESRTSTVVKNIVQTINICNNMFRLKNTHIYTVTHNASYSRGLMSDALQFYWKDVWSHTSSMTSTVRTCCHMI